MKLLKHIITASKVIVAIGVIGGTAVWLGNIGEGQGDIMDAVEKISVEQGSLSEGLTKVVDTIDKLDDNIEALKRTDENHAEALNKLAWMIENKEAFTPDQWRIIMDEYLKKNTLGSMQKIESVWTLSEIDPIRER